MDKDLSKADSETEPYDWSSEIDDINNRLDDLEAFAESQGFDPYIDGYITGSFSWIFATNIGPVINGLPLNIGNKKIDTIEMKIAPFWVVSTADVFAYGCGYYVFNKHILNLTEPFPSTIRQIAGYWVVGDDTAGYAPGRATQWTAGMPIINQ